MSTTGLQFGRVAQLLVANHPLAGDITGRDLSQLQFSFFVRASDVDTPNTLVVKIYNLSSQTEAEITSQYTQISLAVGYEGTPLSVIFVGTIKAFRKGKESSVDKFLEISAADGDIGYSYGFLSATLASGAMQSQVAKVAAYHMQVELDKTGLTLIETGGLVYPRGKVLFGLARAKLGDVASTLNARWSIQSGIVKIVPVTSYLPGTVVVLNSETGMIGIPESTDNGVEVECLLNPLLQVGYRVQIDSNAIVQLSTTAAEAAANTGINFPSYTSHIFPATVQHGLGIYRIIVVESSGDTRGQDWTSHLVCLAIDPSSPPATAVLPSG